VSATGCHQRNFTRVAAGGVVNVVGENSGKASDPGPPGFGTVLALANGTRAVVAAIVSTTKVPRVTAALRRLEARAL
jgi:hypothetical protein